MRQVAQDSYNELEEFEIPGFQMFGETIPDLGGSEGLYAMRSFTNPGDGIQGSLPDLNVIST
jgi:hypothetical protein